MLGLECDDDSFEGSAWGDPHIRTFDGLNYDCQGSGEFIVAYEKESGFMIQARFEGVTWNPRVTRTTAVVATAGDDMPKVQFSFDYAGSRRKNLVLYVDGNSRNATEGYEDEKVSTSQESKQTYKIRFKQSGLSVKVTKTGTSMNVIVRLPRSMSTNVTGLLGTPDGNSANDWVDRLEGEARRLATGIIALPPPGSLNKQPAYDYCTVTWCISDPMESLFVYEESYGFGNYSHCAESYRGPIDTSTASSPELRALCGMNEACLIDGIVMGIDYAKKTLEALAASRGNSLFSFVPSLLEVNIVYNVAVTVDLSQYSGIADEIEAYSIYEVNAVGEQLPSSPVITLLDSGSGHGDDGIAGDFIFSNEWTVSSTKAGETLGFQAVPIIDGNEDQDNPLMFISVAALQSFSAESGVGDTLECWENPCPPNNRCIVAQGSYQCIQCPVTSTRGRILVTVRVFLTSMVILSAVTKQSVAHGIFRRPTSS